MSDNKTALYVSIVCFFGLIYILGTISGLDIFTGDHLIKIDKNPKPNNLLGLVSAIGDNINVVYNFFTFPFKTGETFVSSMLIFLIGAFMAYLILLVIRGN